MENKQLKRPDTPLAPTVHPSIPKSFTDSLDKARGKKNYGNTTYPSVPKDKYVPPVSNFRKPIALDEVTVKAKATPKKASSKPIVKKQNATPQTEEQRERAILKGILDGK